MADVVTQIPRLAPRKPDGHKGNYGRVLVVGGSRGMIGAPALAANAALRAGAGLVTLALPEPIQLAAASLCPCCTSVPLPACGGQFSEAAVEPALAEAAESTVLAVGPGMGVSPAACELVVALLQRGRRPVVADADALNNLAERPRWPDVEARRLVLTPHPGEFARLTGLSVAQVQADRVNLAVRFAAEHGGLVLVLKGRGTVVADGDRWFVNATGNPGMATGGAGDVLTGVIAALVGQGMSPFDAACLGVHVHGLAGDLAARRLGMVGLIASDLIDSLPEAFAALA